MSGLLDRGPLDQWEGEPVTFWRNAWDIPALEVHARIGSTNDRALELAAEGRGSFTVVLAQEQTSGRGRRGASWHSPAGSGLWMSAVLPGPGPASHLPLLVGLAVAEAVERAAGWAGSSAPAAADPGASGAARLGIKWPNDLFVGSRKVGGILCESVADTVVAGIGLNVRSPAGGFPDGLDGLATTLEDEGVKSLSFSVLAGDIVRSLKERCERPTAALSAEALAGLRARDVLVGRAVRTEERGPGTAVGLDPDGALVLERADGSRVRVASGSVRPE